ncbi:MAG: DUF1015 domain-containing protein [Oscillospiraceae bacterium]|nr:DUF1015 domain-containing protein [Oscillospiraceae bacterium]
MGNRFFRQADILLPTGVDMAKWAVIACDQFSSDPGYWERVKETAAGEPSTLDMVVPEALLGTVDKEKAAGDCAAAMERYLAGGLFRTLPASLVYVEREVTGGARRRGLVGCIDLEAYDYAKGSVSPIRASEKTVADRLPPRIAVRRRAALELPHVMVLISDPDRSVIEPLGERKNSLPKLYDFELMEGGGHIEGYALKGDDAEAVLKKADALFTGGLSMVIGDGNHSLAAAKALWDEIKPTVPASGRETHPARFALVEVNNAYGEGVAFEPIHRVVFGTDAEKLASFMKARFSGEGRAVTLVTGREKTELSVPAGSHGELVALVQNAVDEFSASCGGEVDYIHDDETAESMGRREGCAALLLPAMDKAELFRTVEAGEVFPKKSFSIGHARDKRYYVECRRIRPDEP